MTHALVLIAAKNALDVHHVKTARDAAVAAGARAGVPHWLSDGEACDIPFEGALDAVCAAARDALLGEALDVNAVALDGRRKRLLVADMDSTIISCECIDEIADAAGIKPQVAAITERAMRGELVFEDALRERVALLKGLPQDQLATVYEKRVRLNPGAKALVQTMRKDGALTALVSGGFTYFTGRVAAETGFDIVQANELHIAGGKLLGTVAEPILGREAKRALLVRLARERSIPLGATLAVGDGANDLDMIRASGLGVAYHAKPVVAAAAAARIDHGDLRALLFLQGYAAAEIAG